MYYTQLRRFFKRNLTWKFNIFLIFLEVAAAKEKNSAPGIDPDAEEKKCQTVKRRFSYSKNLRASNMTGSISE
jgi:hypothetical protein